MRGDPTTRLAEGVVDPDYTQEATANGGHYTRYFFAHQW